MVNITIPVRHHLAKLRPRGLLDHPPPQQAVEGGHLRGGGGGDSDVGGGGDVRLLGPLVGLAVVLLFFESNCDFIALKFLVERVRAAFCFPWPLVELLLLDEAGDEAGLFCSNMEIRSLSAFLTAGELML